MIATFACFLLIGWNLWGPHQTFQHASAQQERVQELIASITQLEAQHDAAKIEELRRSLDAHLRS